MTRWLIPPLLVGSTIYAAVAEATASAVLTLGAVLVILFGGD